MKPARAERDIRGFELAPHTRDSIEQSINRTGEVLGFGRKSQELVRRIVTFWAAETRKRGNDISSPEIEEARNQQNLFFNNQTTYLTLCSDLRTSSTLEMGRVPKVGGAQRDLGAKPQGIMVGLPGYIIDTQSAYILGVQEATEINPQSIHIHDSHVACAARLDEEITSSGQELLDRGLHNNIRFRNLMIRAIREHVRAQTGIEPIFTHHSFDPRNGGTLIGLDADSLLKEERFYTDEVLEGLTHEGRIFSTIYFTQQHLINNFQRYTFPFDLIYDYRNSLLTFWQNLNMMKGEVLPLFKQEIARVYTQLSRPFTEEILDATAKVAMANAYISYLNTDSKSHYKFDEHTESLILVSEGEESGPFRMSPLTIEGQGNFTQRLRLAQRVIRSARVNNKGYPTEPDAPIPLILATRIRSIFNSRELVKWLKEINWAEVNEFDLLNLNLDHVRNYFIQNHGNLPLSFIDAVVQSIYKMSLVLRADDPNNGYLYRRGLFPIPIITTDSRIPVSAIPIFPEKLKRFED